MADDFERGGSALYARLARTHAEDPLVAAIVGEHEPRWEAPLRLFGGVHYLGLAGLVADPWSSFPEVLADYRDWLERFVAEQPVQTNEVQRCWGLLPGFLSVAERKPLDLVELGPSGGLNLFWDRYRYRYGQRVWGADKAPLELVGKAYGGPPDELFAVEVAVRKRVGIDRRPVDVTSGHGARLLQAFVWADQPRRLERLRRAIETARANPPELMEGDYVEVLPSLLQRRELDALTVVYHSASAVYLKEEAAAKLEEIIAAAGKEGSLAHVSYETLSGAKPGFHGFALEVQSWPGGERRRLALLDGHANSLEWVAEGA